MYEPSYLNNSFESFDDGSSMDIFIDDVNSLNKISTIKQREERMFKKINEMHNLTYKPDNKCNFDICDVRGNQRFNFRRNVKDNIEDYINTKLYDANSNIRLANKKEENSVVRTESFDNENNKIRILQSELDEMHRNNNNIVMVLIFLVIVVLIQYTKLSNIKFNELYINQQPTEMRKK
jgi:hypothetical protein